MKQPDLMSGYRFVFAAPLDAPEKLTVDVAGLTLEVERVKSEDGKLLEVEVDGERRILYGLPKGGGDRSPESAAVLARCDLDNAGR